MEIQDLARLWKLSRRTEADRRTEGAVSMFTKLKIVCLPDLGRPVPSALFALWLLVLILSFYIDSNGVVFYHAVRVPVYFPMARLFFLAIVKLHSSDLPAANMQREDQLALEMMSFLSQYGYDNERSVRLLRTEALVILNRTAGKDWVARYLPVVIASVIAPLGSLFGDSVFERLIDAVLVMVLFAALLCLIIFGLDLLVEEIRDSCPFKQGEVQTFYDNLTSLLLRLENGRLEEGSSENAIEP